MTYRFNPPKLPSSTVLCPASSTKIAAPAAHVFGILTDTSTWPEWNTFCPAAETTYLDTTSSSSRHCTVIRGDSNVTLHVRLKLRSSLRLQKVVVTEYAIPNSSPPEPRAMPAACYKISWDARGMPRFLLRTHRTNEVQDISSLEHGDEMVLCEYKTWEVMAGPMAWIVKGLYGAALQQRFEDWSRDLKRFAERTWLEEKAAHDG